MALDFLANVAQQVQEEEEKARKLGHSKFRDEWLAVMQEHPERFEKEVVKQKYNQEIVLCPEPVSFMKEFDDYADDQDKCREIFEDMMRKFQRISLKSAPQNGDWFNTTLKGINLRPGLMNNERSSPFAVNMGDLAVHGVIVGRTGSGKSVFLNNLIFNLLTEYAPWELDLYLADFKKVEFSRYMTKYETPHLKACAATSEIRYVVSLIQNLVDSMYARQNFFARLGLQKIEDFRKRYPQIVLPRVLLVVDEFQQMFLESTSKEEATIQDLLMAIIKLGRATGYHLLFASQEMSGALSAKALANFKIRFALPCDAEISSAILGNPAASTLEVGDVLVNTESGKENDNKRYKVPFIADDSDNNHGKPSYFYNYLKNKSELSNQYGMTKIKKFYQEDSRKDIADLENVLLRIREYKNGILSADGERYFDILTLGEAVVYNDKRIDLETVFIERGKNKNIFAVSPNVDDITYIQKMLAVNYRLSSVSYYGENDYTHALFSFNDIIRKQYMLENDLQYLSVFEGANELDAILQLYQQRDCIRKALKTATDCCDFIRRYFTEYGQLIGQNSKAAIEEATSIFANVHESEIESVCNNLLDRSPNYEALTNPIMYYYKNRVLNKSISEIFNPFVIWISGMDNVDTTPRWFWNVLANSVNVNIMIQIFMTSEDSNIRQYVQGCDYLFLGGTNPKIYDKCGVNYTNKSMNSIVIDFKIKSMNTERSFKKYKCQFAEETVPSIDFDAIWQ